MHQGAAPAVAAILPDTATTLVVRREPGSEPEVLLAGPRTHAVYHPRPREPGPSCLQLRIRHGRARPLVREPLAALADRIVPLALPDLAGGLVGLLDGDASAGARRIVAALDQWLAPATASERARRALVVEAVRLLAPAGRHGAGADGPGGGGGGGGDVRVADVARRLHVSERQLRNVFAQAVGLSPKQFARIDRVRTVLARGRHDGLARAATAAGYYDQPHMTVEFRRLMGVPPGAYLAGHRPTPAPCARP